MSDTLDRGPANGLTDKGLPASPTASDERLKECGTLAMGAPGAVRCGLPAGHGGAHLHETPSGWWGWANTSPGVEVVPRSAEPPPATVMVSIAREERDHWIRLFNRLEAAVSRHVKAKSGTGFTDDADNALHAAHRKVLAAASLGTETLDQDVRVGRAGDGD